MPFDKNAKLDDDRYRSSPPSLKADKLDDDVDSVVITIRDIDEAEIDDPERPNGKRYALKLESNEFPDLPYFVNTTGRRTITTKYGEVPAKWIGKRVPLHINYVWNPQAKAQVRALHVAPIGIWDEMLAAYDREARKGKAPPRRKVAAASRKR